MADIIIKKTVFRSTRENVIKICDLIREIRNFEERMEECTIESMVEFLEVEILKYNSITMSLNKSIDDMEFFSTAELLLAVDFGKAGKALDRFRMYCVSYRPDLKEKLPVPLIGRAGRK